MFETEKSDRYHVDVAYSAEEAIRLLEVGSKCVTDECHDGARSSENANKNAKGKSITNRKRFLV